MHEWRVGPVPGLRGWVGVSVFGRVVVALAVVGWVGGGGGGGGDGGRGLGVGGVGRFRSGAGCCRYSPVARFRIWACGYLLNGGSAAVVSRVLVGAAYCRGW